MGVPILSAAELTAIRYAERLARESRAQLRALDRIGTTIPDFAFGSVVAECKHAAAIGSSLPAVLDQIWRSFPGHGTSARQRRREEVANAIRRGATGPVGRALARRVARAVLRPRKGPVVLARTNVHARVAHDAATVSHGTRALTGAATPCAPPAAA